MRTTAPAALTIANPIPGPGGMPLTSVDSSGAFLGKADGATLFQAKILPGEEDCTSSTLSPSDARFRFQPYLVNWDAARVDRVAWRRI